MFCWTVACARRQAFTSSTASRSVASSNTAGWRSFGPSRTVTTTSHCSRIFAAASQPTMGGMHCCLISAKERRKVYCHITVGGTKSNTTAPPPSYLVPLYSPHQDPDDRALPPGNCHYAGGVPSQPTNRHHAAALMKQHRIPNIVGWEAAAKILEQWLVVVTALRYA